MNLNAFILNIIDLLKLEKYSNKIMELLNSQNLLLIIIYLSLIFLIFFIGIYKIVKNKSILLNKLVNFNNKQKNLIKTICKQKIYLIFVIPLSLTSFLLFYLPVTYDETFTFINFIDRGIIVSASYYPAPNNHVLYSIISSFVNLFNFKSIIPFRIISIIFFLLSLIVIVKIFLRNSLNLKKYHYLLISVFPLSLVYIYNSSLARGYSLLILLALINIYIIQKILKNNDDKYLKKFSLFTSLAFYTIPSYFYCHIIFCIIIFCCKKNSLIFLIKSNIVILFLTLLFFFPIIIFQGHDFIFQNDLIDKINYNQFFFYLSNMKGIIENEVFGLSIYMLLFFSIITFYFSAKINKWKEFLLLFFIILISILLPYLTRSIAPGRSLHLVYMLTFLMFFLPTKKVMERLNKKHLLILCLSIQLVLSINILRYMPYERYSLNAEDYSKKILGNGNSYFICADLYDPLLIYYKINYEIQNIKIDLSKEKFCNINKIKNYDWVIIDKERDVSKIKPNFDSLLWNFYKN